MMSEEESLSYSEKVYFPTLYGFDAKGKERLWKIWVEGNVIKRLSGLVYGQHISSERTVRGKNLKNKNATTPEEQAILEAERSWTKQLDKNYKPKYEDEEGMQMYKNVMKEKKKLGGQNTNASSVMNDRKQKNIQSVKNYVAKNLETKVIPMKTTTWDLENSRNPLSVLPRVTKHFNFDRGIYVQWKLDGWRCIAKKQSDNSIVLTTNSSKQYPWFKTIREHIDLFWDQGLCLDGLDGELYCHQFYDQNGLEINPEKRFSLIQGICALSNKEPHDMEEQICFYVFDIVDLSGKHNQDYRFERLKKLFNPKRLKNIFSKVDCKIVLTETKILDYIEEVPVVLTEFCQAGYEGIILRDRELKYKPKSRSLKMRKFKFFIDKEYVIIGVCSDPGVSNEYFSWKCETEDGKEFKATQKGTREEKINLFENYVEYLGMYLTVTFQEYSNDGIPRFPIAKSIRQPGDF